jgi:hypothetical protein
LLKAEYAIKDSRAAFPYRLNIEVVLNHAQPGSLVLSRDNRTKILYGTNREGAKDFLRYRNIGRDAYRSLKDGIYVRRWSVNSSAAGLIVEEFQKKESRFKISKPRVVETESLIPMYDFGDMGYSEIMRMLE